MPGSIRKRRWSWNAPNSNACGRTLIQSGEDHASLLRELPAWGTREIGKNILARLEMQKSTGNTSRESGAGGWRRLEFEAGRACWRIISSSTKRPSMFGAEGRGSGGC